MQAKETSYRHEVEVERLWLAAEHGCFTFFSMLPVTVLIVIGFWDTASHIGLIIWFILNRAINFARWMIFSHYHARKQKLTVEINKFKNLVLFVSILHGLSWSCFMVWFLFPFDPTEFLLVSLALIIEIMGALLFWYSFLPALIAITLPITITMIYILFLQSNQIYLIASIIVFIACLLGFISSLKLSDVLRHSLFLYFENADLRRDFEEKSMLLEMALENMGQGICMSDQDDRLRLWNRQFKKILEVQEDKVKIDASLSAILASAQPPLVINLENQNIYQQENEMSYEVRQSDLKQGGRVITLTDISDLMKRERSLKKARKEAIEANCAKIRFLATASHDLRQPIHALGLFFAELSARVRSPQTERIIGQIDDSIDAINTMLNALLDVSKLDAGIVKPDVQLYFLNELFSRLNAEFQPIAQENSNSLTIRPTSAVVQTDPAMLERMLRNLLTNALRYTKNGKVLVAARQRAGQLETLVLDTGPGIHNDQLENIFVEFHQLHNPARDRRQGLGLGLAIVKRLANLLQHDLEVTSKLGCGSCFSVFLPLVSKSTAVEFRQTNTATPAFNNALTGCRLLVLDDDIAVCNSMQGLLTQWGCEVITADSSKAAMDNLKTERLTIDLLIVDYRLSEPLSGIEIARSLQAELGYPVGVLIITGDTGPERLQEAEASGFPLLHKPVQPAKLRSTLQFLINKKRLQTH